MSPFGFGWVRFSGLIVLLLASVSVWGEHWAFQPLQRPAVPESVQDAWCRTPVDAFILKAQKAQGLSPLEPADRETLLRRVTIDLTGLPPTPSEREAFLQDASLTAYERVVDRLLASPAFGERMAQWWLDVARFAETDGYEHDKVRAEAWRYRDWVVETFNRDPGYAAFLRMQVAGDEMGSEQAALGTGFLTSGPDMPDINLPEERRHTILNEMTSAAGSAFLGLTLQCAQCHDHKSDPLSQKEFYQLRAFFENIALPPKNRSLAHRVSESGSKAPDTHLMIRGDFRSPGEKVGPAVPAMLGGVSRLDGIRSMPGGASSGRRSSLAEWLTDSRHPLTWRVAANRMWQQHFGKPLVGTPNDLGVSGQLPTHPELLNWLASELAERPDSMKGLHRMIVLSATYRQAGAGKEALQAAVKDPENRWYTRMPRRRLSGEAIRDAMLAASGRLNLEMAGEGVRPPLPAEVTITLLKNQWPVTPDPSGHLRRSLYLFARRNLRFPMFDVFDRPDALASCARRSESTTAPQALTLLHSELSWDCATALARKIGNHSVQEQVQQAFVAVLSRTPKANELQSSLHFLETSEGERTEALADLCLALFNSNAFLYVE